MDEVNFEPERIVVDKGGPKPYKLDFDEITRVTGYRTEEHLEACIDEEDEPDVLFEQCFMNHPNGGNYGLDVVVDHLELASEDKEVWYIWDIGDVFRHTQAKYGERAAMLIHCVKLYWVRAWLTSRIELAGRDYEIITHDITLTGDQHIETILDGIVIELI